MAAYTTIDNPELYFQAKAFTGNAGTLAVTLDGEEDMSPNLVITKPRATSSYGHKVWDTVRGVTDYLETDGTGAEGTGLSGLDSFDSNGFTLGSYIGANPDGAGVIAWCWKAGTSFSNDASATSIGSIDSSGSFSNDSNLSIVLYTGTGSNATIKHGLSSAPKFIIVKCRSHSAEWIVYAGDETDYLKLNENNASADDATRWNDTASTSSVFSIGDHNDVNTSAKTYIAYCFADKQGYLKTGSYIGNGQQDDGPFVYTGFRPACILGKRLDSAGGWWMIDNKRPGYNVTHEYTVLDTATSEQNDGSFRTDFLANGFKCYYDNGNFNAQGGTYHYIAFAEAPFANSNGVPCNAR